MNLPLTGLDLPLKYLHSSIDLLSSLFLSATVVDLIFLGDSVSTQHCQFLICDLIRLGLPLSTRDQHSQVESFHHTITEFTFPLSFLNRYLLIPDPLTVDDHTSRMILRIHNKQFNLPCMNLTHPDCHDLLSSSLPITTSASASASLSVAQQQRRSPPRGAQLISNYLKNMIETFTNISYLDHQSSSLSPSPSLSPSSSFSREINLILNYGLHLKKAHRPWAIPGMVRGIFEEAKKFTKPMSSPFSSQPIRVRLLWRETSAQAFGYAKGSFLSSSPTLLSHTSRWLLPMG
jgi:hypothetical protein